MRIEIIKPLLSIVKGLLIILVLIPAVIYSALGAVVAVILIVAVNLIEDYRKAKESK